MIDLDYLYAHHAVGLCPEERCVTARANLEALAANLAPLVDYADRMAHDLWGDWDLTDGPLTNEAEWQRIRAALQGRVASREGRFHGDYPRPVYLEPADYDRVDDPPVSPPREGSGTP